LDQEIAAMPIYEYQCTKCREVCEVLQKAKDKPPEKCPKCGGSVVKLISSPAIQFKGSGWYITDHPKKGSAPAEGKAEAKTAPAETKAETKTAPAEAAKPKPEKTSS
jgi:putative FmdB family regulatory protein